jgi:hypothetical protein
LNEDARGIIFIWLATHLTIAIRDVDLTSLFQPGTWFHDNEYGELLEGAVKWRKHVDVDSMKAPNLRFLPLCRMDFDEAAWRTFAKSYTLVDDLDENALLTQLKDWITNGV